MIRVAVVIEALGPGGAERLLVDTARVIDRRRFDLRVFTLYRARRHYAAALQALDVEERCLDLGGLPSLFRGVRLLARALAERPVDLVHTHLYGANLVGRVAASVRGLPVVSTLHGVDYEPVVRQSNPQLGFWKHAMLRQVDRTTIRLARAHTVAVSDYVAASARRHLGVPPERVTVIHNAVDTATFRPASAEERLRVRQSLGIAPNECLILTVGRLIPEKAQGLLLDAVARLPPGIPAPRVVLVGDGSLRSDLEARARALGMSERVLFLGVRSDVPLLMGAADVLALPSLHEGFGLVLVEAMACGLPVVASRVGPIPEIVEGGVTGLLFPSGDAQALTSALQTLLADPALRTTMGEHARASAVARFGVANMVEKLQDLYESLAQHRPQGG